MSVFSSSSLYIGLMSGTSLDGVDGVLVALAHDFPATPCQPQAFASRAFDPQLKAQLLALQTPGENEIEREALASNALAQLYAQVVQDLLSASKLSPSAIRAIGAHGQTIRHRPELGFTRQSNNPALLAELTGIDVIADFRSRDVAAGGQGAPLVPAFHQALFGVAGSCRVLLNVGGIANLSILAADGAVTGFDTGPGNVLLDSWIKQQQGAEFDAAGAWAASGKVQADLLAQMLQEPYFSQPAPKSTGRDLFDAAWLARQLAQWGKLSQCSAADVQATLVALTAQSVAQALQTCAAAAQTLYVCGGGAHNLELRRQLQTALPQTGISDTTALGVPVMQVEALAFAWLAQRHCLGLAGNLPAVTGARGLRVLGACYPA